MRPHGHTRWASPARGLLAWSVLLLLLPAAVRTQESAAQEPPTGLLARAGITGSVRAGFWSSTRDLDSEEHLGAGLIWLKAARPITDRVSFLVEGLVALRGPMDDGEVTDELREAYVDVRLGRLDLRLGRQIVAWGRADGVNPTDNLTGDDLTLLVPDEDDRRLGATAVRASYYAGGVAITALWLPELGEHRFPLPPAPPGLTVRSAAPEWPGDQWAVRAERTGGAIDWSASWFQGRDLFPDLGLQEAATNPAIAPVLRLSHHRLRIAGADMAANVGRFGLRAEGAYVGTEDSAGEDPYTKNPFVFIVVGGDRTWGEHLNLNVQYLYRYVVDYRPVDQDGPALSVAIATQQAVLNSQVRRVQHGASFRVAYTWLRDTLEAECAAAGFFGPRGLTIRPRIAYAVSDHWKVLAGAEVFRGEASSVFGLLRPNSAAYLEARWSF